MKIDMPKFDLKSLKNGAVIQHKLYTLRMMDARTMQITPKDSAMLDEMFAEFLKVCNSKAGRTIKMITYQKEGKIILTLGI